MSTCHDLLRREMHLTFPLPSPPRSGKELADRVQSPGGPPRQAEHFGVPAPIHCSNRASPRASRRHKALKEGKAERPTGLSVQHWGLAALPPQSAGPAAAAPCGGRPSGGAQPASGRCRPGVVYPVWRRAGLASATEGRAGLEAPGEAAGSLTLWP